jgi:hypothetical protein
VRRDRALAKFWLEPVALAESANFPAQELGTLRGLVVENHVKLVEAWHEYFSR